MTITLLYFNLLLVDTFVYCENVMRSCCENKITLTFKKKNYNQNVNTVF